MQISIESTWCHNWYHSKYHEKSRQTRHHKIGSNMSRVFANFCVFWLILFFGHFYWYNKTFFVNVFTQFIDCDSISENTRAKDGMRRDSFLCKLQNAFSMQFMCFTIRNTLIFIALRYWCFEVCENMHYPSKEIKCVP